MIRPMPVFACLAVILFACSAFAAEPEPARKTLKVCGVELTLMTGDEVKALGFPWADVPDDQNAAMIYIQGANLLHELKYNPAVDPQYQHVIDNGWDDALKELAGRLDKAKPALDLYRKGAAMRLFQAPYSKTSMLAGMLLPELAKAREAVRLLAAEARRFEAKGQHKQAVDNYLAAIHVGGHHGTSRTLIDQLVGIACIQIAAEASFKGIYRQNYPKDELKRYLAELTALRGGLPSFVHAMQCERAFGLATIDDIMRLGPAAMSAMGGYAPNVETDSPLKSRFFRILMPDQAMKKDMAGYYDRNIEDAKKPFFEVKARGEEDLLKECKPWDIFAQLLLPALGRARVNTERCHASIDLLRLAVALQLYRQETGVYPDSLEWLVKDKIIAELPADPFSGKPFLYKLKDAEFVLYSVNDNMKDDGGKIERDPMNGQSLDLGYTSKLPPVVPYKPKPNPDER